MALEIKFLEKTFSKYNEISNRFFKKCILSGAEFFNKKNIEITNSKCVCLGFLITFLPCFLFSLGAFRLCKSYVVSKQYLLNIKNNIIECIEKQKSINYDSEFMNIKQKFNLHEINREHGRLGVNIFFKPVGPLDISDYEILELINCIENSDCCMFQNFVILRNNDSFTVNFSIVKPEFVLI